MNMFDLLVRKFISNYEDIQDGEVREKYGTLCSVISIICNLFMSSFKIIFGFITGSVAISADGFNNLSDMGSNLATLFGFKLANKHPDADHPYGHGRIEYIVGMIIAFLILYVGFSSLKESVMKLISKEAVTFSVPAVVVLVISITLKLWMASFNSKTGDKLDSASLKAAGQDSLNDVIMTSATLFSTVAILFTDLPLDALIGILVSAMVLKSGIEIFKSTMDPLLGKAPDASLIKEIEEYTKSYDKVIGIHDLMFHDYGPSRQYMSMHVEVNADDNIMDIHDEIDNLEKNILKKYGIMTTIHMDPVDQSDSKTAELKEVVLGIVKGINPSYNIHDFRIVSGPTHTNMIFDVLLPIDDETAHDKIKNEIEKAVKAYDESLCCVMQIEHSYV